MHDHKHLETFIHMVQRVGGVYTGFALLDFVNGKQGQTTAAHSPHLPLEIVMDVLATEEVINFFTEMNDDTTTITFDVNPLLHQHDACSRVVIIQQQEVRLAAVSHPH